MPVMMSLPMSTSYEWWRNMATQLNIRIFSSGMQQTGRRASHLLADHFVQVRVRRDVRTVNRKILHVEQHDGRHPGCLPRLDMLEVDRLHVIQHECRPAVFLHESHFHVVQFDSPGMADEEAISRQHAEHRGLGILLFALRRGGGFARWDPARGPEEESLTLIHI